MQPQFGSDKYSICRLKVVMKDYVYRSHDGVMSTEPINEYRDWMVKHDYDPEHGKNMPVQLAATPGSAAGPASPAAAPPASAPQRR